MKICRNCGRENLSEFKLCTTCRVNKRAFRARQRSRGIKHHVSEHEFTDALREFLGLEPLYSTVRKRVKAPKKEVA